MRFQQINPLLPQVRALNNIATHNSESSEIRDRLQQLHALSVFAPPKKSGCVKKSPEFPSI